VTEEDFREVLQTPRMDEAVAEHLPLSKAKMAPSGYSPFWENELALLDARLATNVRLASVSTQPLLII
jgi:hypothetical protein